MSSLYGKKSGNPNMLEKMNQNWANQYEPEIESIRNTGKAPEPSVWDSVKRGWNEVKLDTVEGLHPSVNGYNNPSFDLDEARTKMLEEERASALRQYLHNQNRLQKSLPATEVYPTDSWQKMRDQGKY